MTNVVPDGKLCKELYLSQVAVRPADTEAIEITFFKLMYVFDRLFIKHTGRSIYTREVSDEDYERINRFHCRDLNFPDRLPLIDTPISCELATL